MERDRGRLRTGTGTGTGTGMGTGTGTGGSEKRKVEVQMSEELIRRNTGTYGRVNYREDSKAIDLIHPHIIQKNEILSVLKTIFACLNC